MEHESKVSQAVARPVRTGAQFVTSYVVIEFVDSVIVDMTDRQYAASVGLLALVIGFVQVLVENKIGKAFLRKPEPPAEPVAVVEDAAATDPGPTDGATYVTNVYDDGGTRVTRDERSGPTIDV